MSISRVKTWGAEVLLFADLNNEFDNLCNNVVVEPFTATATVDLNGQTLILDTDGNTSLDAATNDTIDITVAGADDFRFTANLLTLLSGSSLSVVSGNITVDAGNLTITDGATAIADNDTRTNTVATPLVVGAQTSGTPAAGIGTGILVRAESGDEAPSDFGQLEFAASDVNAGSEDTYFQVLLRIGGAALAAAYQFVSTGSTKAIFTHANATSDRTYTLPNTSTNIVGHNTIDTLTNKTIDAQGTGNSITNISTSALKTATGSATLGEVSGTITMNDYAFFPSLTNTNPAAGTYTMQAIGSTADPGNTVGRFQMLGADFVGGGVVFTARWRYFTASDDATIWIAENTVTGVIQGVWASDDPIPDGSPGLLVGGCTSRLVKSSDLERLSILTAKSSDARDYIRDNKLSMRNQAWRALQLVSNDMAPSKWIMENCVISKGRLESK